MAWNRVGNKEKFKFEEEQRFWEFNVPVYHLLCSDGSTCNNQKHQPFSHPFVQTFQHTTSHHAWDFSHGKPGSGFRGKREAWHNYVKKMHGRIQPLKTKMTNWKNRLIFHRKWHLHSRCIFQPVIFLSFFQAYRGVLPAPKGGSNSSKSSKVMKDIQGGPRKTSCHRKGPITPGVIHPANLLLGWSNLLRLLG